MQNGVVPMSRVNDAVSRVLTQKFELGLFEHPFTDRANIDQVGDAAHRAVAARAAAESQVLLKNAHHVLPLSTGQHVYVAGSNADNLGAQTGGWTLTWQGQPGSIADPGTTILAGIQAKDSHVTYSPQATGARPPATTSAWSWSASIRTPRARAMSASTPTSTNGNIASLNLNSADHAAVDTVCHAMPCVVLVVSGRPMTITDQLPEIDGLVASWLPGTEGEGVADTLFGDVPFTGQLPQSWPRSLSQEPINVGDPHYNPLFPFGWGLRTTSTRSDADAAARALGAGPGNHHAANRLWGLVRDRRDWNHDGSARRPGRVLSALRRVAASLGGASFAQQEAVVGVARDVAQAAAVSAGGPNAASSPAMADADNALLTGDPGRAVSLLGRAYGSA